MATVKNPLYLKPDLDFAYEKRYITSPSLILHQALQKGFKKPSKDLTIGAVFRIFKAR